MNAGMTPETVVLGPLEEVPERPFTAVDRIADDLQTLQVMLGDVRSVLADVDAGRRTLVAFQKLVWREKDLTHRLLICNESRLRSHPRLCVVGFFGERHPELDPMALEDANSDIVAGFADYPGILSYSSVELGGDGRWANMVLHDHPSDREYWRRNQRHVEAVKALSPVHYRNVRIHNAELTSPLAGSPTIVIQRTKYFDYSGGSAWRAERSLPAAAPANTPADH